MSERWERRLKELGEIDAPRSMDARVQQGPHGSPPRLPSTTRRIAAAVLAIAVFAAAGIFAWRAFDPGSPLSDATGDQDTPLSIDLGMRPAADGLSNGSLWATLSYDVPWANGDRNSSVRIAATVDSYEGDDPGGAPTYVLPVPVLSEAPLVFTGDVDPTHLRAVEVSGTDQERVIALTGSDTRLALDPGHWILEVHAESSGRSFTAHVGVWVVPQGPQVAWVQLEPPTPHGPKGRLVTNSGSLTGLFEGGVWDPHGRSPEPMDGSKPHVFSPSDYLEVPSGTVLAVSGAEAANGDLQTSDAMGDGIGLDLGSAAAPLVAPPGRYLLRVQGEWQSGTVGWVFPIEIVPFSDVTPTHPSDSAASLPPITGAHVSARVRLPGSPDAIAVGEGGIWVDLTESDSSVSEVVRIDPGTNEQVASIPLPGFSQDIATGEHGVWASSYEPIGSNNYRPSLVRIDPSTDVVIATIPHVGGPLAVGAGSVWGVSRQGDAATLVGVDPATNEIRTRIALPSLVERLAVTDDAVWAIGVPASGAARTLLRIDPTGVANVSHVALPISGTLYGPVTDGSDVWVGVCCPQPNRTEVVRVDGPTGVAHDPVPMSLGLPFAAGLDELWLLSERGMLYGLSAVDGSLREFLTAEWPAGNTTAALDENARSIWIADYHDAVTRIDLTGP